MRYLTAPSYTAALLALATLSSAAVAQMGALPGGWFASNDSASDYHVGSDVSRRPGGSGMISGYIRATVKNPSSSAALTQTINAEHLRGQRVRLTGYVRRSGDSGLAQLFLRVEGNATTPATDYTAPVFTPAKETRDGNGWIMQSIVVDVPKHCSGLRIGFVSVGADEAWLDDVRFELVNNSVALAGHEVSFAAYLGTMREIASDVKRRESVDRMLAMEFVNLDFESRTRMP